MMTTNCDFLRRLASCLGLLLVLPIPLRAQSRQPLQELFFAQVPYTQDKGEYQFTLTHSRLPGAGLHRFETEFAVEYGISDAWQVEVEALGRSRPVAPAESHTMLQSASFSLQRGFVSPGQTFRLMFGAELEAPLGESQDDESVALGPSVALMKDVLSLHGLRLVASASLASPLNQRARRAGAETEYAWQAAAFLPVSIVCLTVELNRSSEAYGNSDEASLIAAPGFVISLPHNFEAAMTVPVSFGRGTHVVSRIFRLIYEF